MRKIFFLLLCSVFLTGWVTWSPEVIVTSDGGEDWPEGCHPREVAERLVEFFIAFNAGDQQRLPDFFGERFNWFSATESGQERSQFVAYSRNDLLTYLAERHQQGEQWKLYTVQLGGLVDDEYVNIQYELVRAVDGREQFAVGKGAFLCASQMIYVWSFGTHPHRDASSPSRFDCPTPTGEVSAEDTVIACSG